MGDSFGISYKLFKDSYSNAQSSSKLFARRYGPFKIMELVGTNAVRLDLPRHIRFYQVVHVSHTKSHREYPSDLAQKVRTTPVSVDSTAATPLFAVDRILAHRRRGRGYQWLTLMEDSSTHEAQWQHTRDFIDDAGTVTKAFHTYIVQKHLLTHLH